MKNYLYKKLEKNNPIQWDDLLSFDFKNNLLSLKELLPEYYAKFINNAELIGVIPALPKGDEKQRAYFSCPTLEIEKPENSLFSDLMPRLAPAFIIDNTQKLLEMKESLFEIDGKIPKFMDYKAKDYYKDRVFIIDSEVSRMYNYQNGQYKKSDLFEDMRSHILSNPVVLFFHGCDDGHVGLRFPDRIAAIEYIKGLNVFEDVFDGTDEKFNQNILSIKKSTGQSVSGLMSKNLEFHN